jgi:hypothetical protein
MSWKEIAVIGLLVLAGAGCQKEETPSEAQTMPFSYPPQGAFSPNNPLGSPMVVPEAVKGRWKAVRLRIEDKRTGANQEYSISLGSELAIPDSNLTVRVNEFLPDLIIANGTFTSASGEPLNPSVHVQVLEDGKEVFNGWLFQLFPAVHPFRHERFNIVFREAVLAS